MGGNACGVSLFSRDAAARIAAIYSCFQPHNLLSLCIRSECIAAATSIPRSIVSRRSTNLRGSPLQPISRASIGITLCTRTARCRRRPGIGPRTVGQGQLRRLQDVRRKPSPALAYGLVDRDPQYRAIQERLAGRPVITVPAIALDGDADGVIPVTDGSAMRDVPRIVWHIGL